jgi:hypothetical protein
MFLLLFPSIKSKNSIRYIASLFYSIYFRRLFEQNVQKAMKGGSLNGIYFERCVK